MAERSDTTILLDIYERLGGIEQQLEAGSRRHDEFRDEIAEIRRKIEPLPLIGEAVKDMKPIVDDYSASRNKMAGMFLVASMIAGGIGFFASEIKAAFVGR